MSSLASKQTEFVGSIDCGTTSCRFFIFDQFANIVARHQIEFNQIYPHPGWHEHDPTTYLTAIDACIELALRDFIALGHEKSSLKCVGITNQRETTVVWDRQTGKPLTNAIVWPDARNSSTVKELKEKALNIEFRTANGVMVGEEGIRALTGLPISTYFSAVKFAWMNENLQVVREAKEAGTLMLGTVDSWLLYNFTGGVEGGVHITDYTNASRTLCLNLHSLEWDPQLLDFFGIPLSALGELVSNSEIYGEFKSGLLAGIPISGLVGDQQSALIGNKCLARGSAKQTYGTGCFMLYHTGTDVVQSTHGLLTTVAYKAGPTAATNFALEGSIAVGGSSVAWLRDNLGLIKTAQEVGELAAKVENTGGVYFVTGFSGLFAPYWDPDATGCIIGLSSYTTKEHIARATLEATCFQTRALVEAMAKDTGGDHRGLDTLKVDGGMTSSDVTMQLQADICGIEVERPEMRESTALGAALMAGAALKLFGWNLSAPATLSKVNTAGVKSFKPTLGFEEREKKYAGWNRAVERASKWKLDE